MRPRACAGLAALLAGVVGLAIAQQQVRFTGETVADARLIHDVLQPIAQYIQGSLACSNIELVEAAPLPATETADKSLVPAGESDAQYELWTVTYCGKQRSFQVALWPAKEGGMMFGVQLRKGGS